jgi:hypothetical protein
MYKDMWYIDTMEFYSAMKIAEVRSFIRKWMEQEIVMLNEISHSHKEKYNMFL